MSYLHNPFKIKDLHPAVTPYKSTAYITPPYLDLV